ncbi:MULTISPECIES: helix-turn-helix transcriptional regulator [unclassified Variovorax]|uniref:helix-turn-helix transcriptional regulator n=2 Tax=unclassified Variovorax TaxID=663243 RepID=UPI0009FF527A|nr:MULTISPECIES: helix-turn-helix transcriptional regulator [unclassified Variovorax]
MYQSTVILSLMTIIAPSRLRELRIAAGLTQTALGKELGVGKARVSQMERAGEGLDRLSTLEKLASILGVTIEDLRQPEGAPSKVGHRRQAPEASAAGTPLSSLSPLQQAAVQALVAACASRQLSDRRLVELLGEWHGLA